MHVDHVLVGVGGDLRNAAAGDVAGETGLVGDQPVVLDALAVDRLGALELAGREIARGQAAEGVDQVDRGRRAQFREALPAGAFRQVFVVGPDGGHVIHGPGDPDPLVAADGDGLEVLGPHDRPDAGPARGPVLVVDDAREPHQVLARRPDAGHPEAGHAGLVADGVLGFRDHPAPYAGGIADLDAVVVHEEVAGTVRPPFHDDHVVAGELEFRAPVAP